VDRAAVLCVWDFEASLCQLVVFTPPRLGIRIDAIRFGFGVNIGTAFRPWGCGASRIVWNAHAVIINNAPWDRFWANSTVYVHPYSLPRYVVPRPPERHPAIVRSPRERDAARSGRARIEEHRHGDDFVAGRSSFVAAFRSAGLEACRRPLGSPKGC
jgi:hypothetical protein